MALGAETGGARRSWLLVPASRPGDLEAAARSGADCIVLDVVEFVAERDKPQAREAVRGAIERLRATGAAVFVQIDPQYIDGDVECAAWPGLTGVVISRTESPQTVAETAALLECFETEREMKRGSLEIIVALETAKGNHAGYDILRASPRVTGVTLSRADLVMDLRPEPSGEIHLMEYLMQRLVILAGAVGVKPIGAWWRAPDRGLLATPQNTHAAGARGRAIGFKGALCLKPEQVEPLNRAYGS